MSEEAQSAEDERPDFAIGDVVRLRSGGPSMTVEAMPDSGLIECVWFNNADTPYRGTLRREILRNIGREQEMERKLALDAWRATREVHEEQRKKAEGAAHASRSWTGR